MRDDILQIISSSKNVTNAIVLTHNIDFVFLQTVVLASFHRCGHPTITVFADAACASESFAHQQPMLAGLGVRYRVVPVAMKPGYRFHPKALFLSGEKAATLLVGSGNLTFGGWRENAEVWVRFDSEKDGAAPFYTFRKYLTEILARVPLSDVIAAEIDDAFDTKSKKWMKPQPISDDRLVGRIGEGDSLLDRMLKVIGSDPVEELFVCSPYFDDRGDGLREIVTKVGARRTTVLCQPERSMLNNQSWKPVSESATLRRAKFTRASESGEARSTFMHAKFYAFRRAHEVIVLAGSANCSRAALIASGFDGNAELMAVHTVTPTEFEEEILGELNVASEPVLLRDDLALDAENERSSGSALRVLAARLKGRSLLVAFTPSRAVIKECLVDGESAQFSVIDKGVLHTDADVVPRVVIIRGEVDGQLIESAPAWVDDEQRLRNTALSRSLAESIRARIRPGEWNASAWAEVIEVFCKHLTYMPVYGADKALNSLAHDKPSSEVKFTATDVFSEDYRTPSLDSILMPTAPGGAENVQSLQQLLLRWFGIVAEVVEEKDESDGVEKEEEDSDATVDHPEPLKVETTSKSSNAMEDSERDRRRINVFLNRIEEVMTSKEFLAKRSPDYLAADLKVASVLLRIGLREGWVDWERFFDLTQKIWSALFFSSAPQRDMGWLEYRASKSGDKMAFIDAMRSAELSAALIGWKLATSSYDGTFQAVRFEFAAVLAVARLPWLWCGGDPEMIAKELGVLLSHTADPTKSQDTLMQQAEEEWNRLLRRGHALRLLETTLVGTTPAERCDQIGIDELQPGDILWQGKAGYCIVLESASRIVNKHVRVMRLQGNGETRFKASLTIPVRALLSEDVVPYSDDFGEEPRKILSEFLDQLRNLFAS